MFRIINNRKIVLYIYIYYVIITKNNYNVTDAINEMVMGKYCYDTLVSLF